MDIRRTGNFKEILHGDGKHDQFQIFYKNLQANYFLYSASENFHKK